MLLFIILACQPSTVTPELVLLKQLEDNPQQASIICPQLQNTKAIKYCQQIALRPHLWDNPSSIQTGNSLRTIGPKAKHLLPNFAIIIPNHLPSAQECSVQCWEAKAVEQSTPQAALKMCQHIEKKTWRAECIFVIAEANIKSYGYSQSASLCTKTGSFAANCFIHLSNELAKEIPPALSELEYEWRHAKQLAAEIEQHWNALDPRFGEAMRDQFWAKGMDLSYYKAGIVAGNPLDRVPTEAIPHVRAAASLHLMLMEGSQSYSLEEWAKRTNRALIARLPQSAMRPPRSAYRKKAVDPWPSDSNGEEFFPAAFYMNDGRRTFSNQPNIDLLITTLEAAARCQNGQELVMEGQRHPNTLVQWTAKRLSNTQ